jgi:hypothetical protein
MALGADVTNAKYMLILDCCRSKVRGSGAAILPKGTHNVAIAFASSAREVAMDGPTGANGVYTGEFIRHLADPKLSAGVSYERLFKLVKAEVEKKGSQVPDLVDQISDFFHLRPDPSFLLAMIQNSDVVAKLPPKLKHDYNQALKAGFPLLGQLPEESHS